jgi:hypothetical protein
MWMRPCKQHAVAQAVKEIIFAESLFGHLGSRLRTHGLVLGQPASHEQRPRRSPRISRSVIGGYPLRGNVGSWSRPKGH